MGVVLVECGFVLSEDPSTVRIPDVSFVARANMPGDRLPSGYFRGGPDLAVEVVSPHDKARELAKKIADYLAAGTPQVWVVEPNTRTVAVYRPVARRVSTARTIPSMGATYCPASRTRSATYSTMA